MPAPRYVALDGVRGVAAIAVVVHHYSNLRFVPGAWTAVDLFFLLSGFVLMHGYADRIAGGLSFKEFARARLVRLYPFYLVALAVGVVAACLRHASGSDTYGPARLALAASSGLLVLPYFGPPLDAGARVFPLDRPAWSLFFELAVNVAFFGWVARARARWGIPLLVVSCAGYAYLAHGLEGWNAGWGRDNFAVGFPRVTYHFFVGAMLYRLGLQPGSPPGRAHEHALRFLAFASPVLLLVLFQFDLSAPAHASLRNLALFVVAPAVVLSLSRVEVGGVAARTCRWLGGLSYPLYILHVPILDVVSFSGVSAGVRLAAAFGLSLALSSLLAGRDASLRASMVRMARPGQRGARA